MEKHIKYADIKNKKELKTRIKDGVLSVGCYWSIVRKFVAKKPCAGSYQKITVIYSPGYGGASRITRYI